MATYELTAHEEAAILALRAFLGDETARLTFEKIQTLDRASEYKARCYAMPSGMVVLEIKTKRGTPLIADMTKREPQPIDPKVESDVIVRR